MRKTTIIALLLITLASSCRREVPDRAAKDRVLSERSEPNGPTPDDWLTFSAVRGDLRYARYMRELHKEGQASGDVERRLRAERDLPRAEESLVDFESRYEASLSRIRSKLDREQSETLTKEIAIEATLSSLRDAIRDAEADVRRGSRRSASEREILARKQLDAEDRERMAQEAVKDLRSKLSPYLYGFGATKDTVDALMKKRNEATRAERQR